MSKRAKFFIVSILLGVGLWMSNFFGVERRLVLVLVVSFMGYVLSAIVLFEDLKGLEWLTLMILPFLFTLSSGMFANLLPGAVPRLFGANFQIETSVFLASLLRIFFLIMYIFGMYAILLTENIFSVASIRTIQLFRAARSVSFIMSLVISFLIFSVVFSLRLPFWYIGAISFVFTLILSFGILWSIDLKTEFAREVYQMSAIIAMLMGFLAVVMAFWPIRPFLGSLVLTGSFYSFLGILEQRLVNRMSKPNYLEFVVFNLIIVVIALLTTSWRG